MPPSMTTCATCRPSGPNSRAMLCEIMRSPALAAANCAKPALPRKLPDAPVKITVPRPRGASRRAASRPTKKPAKQPTRQNSSKSCAVTSRKSILWLLPALKTTRSAGSRPLPGAMARSNSATTSGSRVASVKTASALPPAEAIVPTTCSILAGVRPATSTCWPSLAKRRATAAPTPCSAPTPTTTAVDCLTLGADSLRTGGQSLDRPLPDRPIDQRRQHAQSDGDPPHGIVGLGHVKDPPREPYAQEGTDLMRQEDDAEQHRHPGRPEERCHKAAGERDGRQPQQPKQSADDDDRRGRHGQIEETKEQHGATQVDQAQALSLLQEPPRLPGDKRADDIGDTHHR